MTQRKAAKTPKQYKAAKLISVNISSDKPRPLKEILKEAGYSESMTKKPSQIIKSKGFQEIMEEAGITDDLLAETLNDGLRAVTFVKTEKVVGVGKSRIKTEDVVLVPDINTRHKYLETGLRLKGHGKVDNNISVNFNTLVQQQREKYPIQNGT